MSSTAALRRHRPMGPVRAVRQCRRPPVLRPMSHCGRRFAPGHAAPGNAEYPSIVERSYPEETQMTEHNKAAQARKGLIDSVKGKAKEIAGAFFFNETATTE